MILIETKISMPTFLKKSKKTGKKLESIATLNNISEWYRYKKTEIKNIFKNNLKLYTISEPKRVYDELVIHYRIVRNTKKNIDKDNVVFALKWIADTLEELGYVDNDNVINFRSYDTVYDTDLPETMIEIKIESPDNKTEWKKIGNI